MKIVIVFVALVALFLAVVVILAAGKPDSFKVERSVAIQSGPSSVVKWVADFHKWKAWSPWENLDSNLQRTFSGADSGVGAKYAWEGPKSGKGNMEITAVDSQHVAIRLVFEKPFAASNESVFGMQATGTQTKLVWTMTGPSPFFPSKIMQVFCSMDKLIGKDFEKGLAGIKKLAESTSAP